MEAQSFGARLRQLRIQAGLTQRELAARIKVDFSYLSKIESGAVPPPSEKVISRLAEALNADKDELIILAGKLPAEIARILQNRETLQRLRSVHTRQIAKAPPKRGGAPSILKRLSQIAIPISLALAVAASLWFAAPAQALDISFPTLPSSGTLGDTYSFTIKIDIRDDELLPIESVDLSIYNSADPTTYTANCTDLPLTATTKNYTSAQTGGGAVSITATTTNWQWFYGYGYALWEPTDTPHYFDYGYGYGYATGAASITYSVSWTSPSGWPTGGYKAKATITANGTTFTKTSSEFTLTTAAVFTGVELAPPTPPPGVTDVSDIVTAEGEFTETVIAESEDGLVALTITEGTIGLVAGEPLSEISIVEMEEPPAPPEDSEVIGLIYDLGPDGATFDPPATLTFTYDPDEIPEGVSEQNLVIAMWDEEAGEWVNLVSTVDPEANTITVSASHFTAFAVIAYTQPAAFTTSDLTISPAEVDIGEKVTITVVVTNTGDLSGSYQVVLKIDKVAVATRDVTLAGGAHQKVTFTVTKDVAGTYNVTVNGLSGTFTVKPAPPPPAPPVAPPVAPPAPPVAPPAVPPPINWWLIGGIIAAVIIISIVIVILIRRRMA